MTISADDPSQLIYNSRFSAVFHLFSRFMLFGQFMDHAKPLLDALKCAVKGLPLRKKNNNTTTDKNLNRTEKMTEAIFKRESFRWVISLIMGDFTKVLLHMQSVCHSF